MQNLARRHKAWRNRDARGAGSPLGIVDILVAESTPSKATSPSALVMVGIASCASLATTPSGCSWPAPLRAHYAPPARRRNVLMLDQQPSPSMPAIRCNPAAAAVLWALAAAAAPAAAATCADLPVTARGDPSGFETLAKAKARGNWRAKVRAMPTLGAAYADWSRALAADYRCGQEGGQHVCTAVAYPCRD